MPQICPTCGEETDGLYQYPGQADSWVCFNCLPPELVDRYPGWRERELLKARQRDQARRNFSRSRETAKSLV